jgi:hypothetical protein
MSEQFPEQQLPVIPPTVGQNDLVRIIKSLNQRVMQLERRLPDPNVLGATKFATLEVATNLSLTTSLVTPTNMAFSMKASGTSDRWIIHQICDFNTVTANAGTAVGLWELREADNVTINQQSAGQVLYRSSAAGERATVAQTTMLTGLAAGTYNFHYRVQQTSGTGYQLMASHSRLHMVKII